MQGKFHDALQLYDNSLAIMEEVFGPEHVSVATYVGNKAGCLMELVRDMVLNANPMTPVALM